MDTLDSIPQWPLGRVPGGRMKGRQGMEEVQGHRLAGPDSQLVVGNRVKS